jgi:hypothetical protein
MPFSHAVTEDPQNPEPDVELHVDAWYWQAPHATPASETKAIEAAIKRTVLSKENIMHSFLIQHFTANDHVPSHPSKLIRQAILFRIHR